MLEDITLGIDKRNIFCQVRRNPVVENNMELSKREQLEVNSSSHLATLLADTNPEIRISFLNLLTDCVEIENFDQNSTVEVELEHDIRQDHPNRTFLVGLANDPEEFSLEQLPTIDERGKVDLYLTVTSGDDEFGIGIEVKTGSGTLKSRQLGKYATRMGVSGIGTISWSRVYSNLKRLGKRIETEYEPMDRTPYLLAHFLEYLEITGHHTKTQRRRAVQYRDRGQDEIQVEYKEGELEIIFRSETAYEEKSNQTHRRSLSPAEFERLFSDIEDRYGKEFISRVFVSPQDDDSGHLSGAEAIAETVGENMVIGEIPGVTTNEDNYLRLFYKSEEREIWLREVQFGADGSSPDGPGSPAGGGEQHVWVVKHDEFEELLTQDQSEGFEKAFRRDLFLHRDFESIREHFENSD